jgi:hypothetical protein
MRRTFGASEPVNPAVIPGSLRDFYLREVRTTLSKYSDFDLSLVVSAKYYLRKHCEGSVRVQEDTKRLIIIMLALICRHSPALAFDQRGEAEDYLLDIDNDRKKVGAYGDTDGVSGLVERGRGIAEALMNTGTPNNKAYGEDWKMFEGWLDSVSELSSPGVSRLWKNLKHSYSKSVAPRLRRRPPAHSRYQKAASILHMWSLIRVLQSRAGPGASCTKSSNADCRETL